MARKTTQKRTKKKVSTASKSRARGAVKKTAKAKARQKPKAKAVKRKTTRKPAKKVVKAAAAKRTKSRTAKKAARKTGARGAASGRARPARVRSSATAVAVRPDVGKRGVGGNAKPLAPAEVEDFRQLLLQKRAEILGDVSTLQGEALNRNRQDAAGDLSSMPIHMADLGSDNYELEFTLGLIEGERAILQEIDEALERIRNKTYGLCLATGNPIGKARLRAKPWAKYCYEYTLAQERGQGSRS